MMVDELASESSLVRGSCWKTKTSRSSMPFGALLLGIFNDWSGAVQSLQQIWIFCWVRPEEIGPAIRMPWNTSVGF